MIPPVVDLEWLREHEDGVVLADVRWYLDGRSGRRAYDEGHLPGAVFVDLDRWLAGPPSADAGRHPLPDPAVFAEGMSALGIGDGTAVVGYDDAGGVVAARLVWMLRATGHAAALLDGGLLAAPGPLEQAATRRQPAVFTPRPWPADRLVDLDDLVAPHGPAGAPQVVLDARDPERYRGDVEPIDPRAGHIPGARNLPCRQNLDADGRFLPVADLQRRFLAAGVPEPRATEVTDVGGAADAAAASDVVSYCGSGVTACHNLLAMEHAGLGAGRLYPGSWSQYSADPDRPIQPAGGAGQDKP